MCHVDKSSENTLMCAFSGEIGFTAVTFGTETAKGKEIGQFLKTLNLKLWILIKILPALQM